MSKKIFPFLSLLFLLIPLVAGPLAQPAHAQDSAPLVLVLTADAPVAPPMAEYIRRGVDVAERRAAEALIIELNTPGGAVDSMSEIIQIIRASQVPVIVYVSPRGGMAASAGTMITIAGHASAMAPETTIGAASPVGGQGEDLGETMQAKLKEDMKATVRTLMADRPPAAVAFAESTIEEAKAATALEAHQMGLVDFIASSTSDLIQQLDGFTVKVGDQNRSLNTANAVQEALQPLLIEELLRILTNPNIVFILLSLGVQAILIELSNPGGWIAGFIGVVALALATYGLGVLPVNWFGIIFLATAFILFILEIKTPTYGALSVAGVISLIVGALVLFNSPGTPQFQKVSVPLVVTISLLTAGVFVGIVTMAIRAQRRPAMTGSESLSRKVGTARSEITSRTGSVQVGGELWSARLDEGEAPIPLGSQVEILRTEKIHLIVRKWTPKN